MSQLDDLLQRGRSPGKFVTRSRFTLSREKAIEKQREFALRDPRQYILELVQAAVFAGASYLAADVRKHSTLVAWVGGRALEERQLENLLDYLFADRSDADTRHLVQLAVGVNALLQRNPSVLRIETGDGTTSLRMDMDSDGNATLGEPETAINGTYLYVEFSSNWFSRFQSNENLEAQHLVEERCMWTPVPILLNGNAPFGYRGSRHIEVFGAQHQQHFDEDGRRGVIAVHRQSSVTGYRVVVGGVWVCTRPLEAIGGQLVGVICDDSLRKTADHSDVVEDGNFVRMLHAVQPHATHLVRNAGDRNYQPPRLPPMPRKTTAADKRTRRAEAAPLPSPLPTVGLRANLSIDQLRAGLNATPGMPLFRIDPQDTNALKSAVDPHRFPWPVLVLTDGQAVSLEDQLPAGTALHKLASAADVDFVRRVVQPDSVLGEHRFSTGSWDITLSLHAGVLPPWGNGLPGIPWCATHENVSSASGRVRGRRVFYTTHRGDPEPTQLQRALVLPGVSVLLQGAGNGPDDAVISAVLREAWSLVGAATHPAERRLLAALMGQCATPAIRADPELRATVTLPVWVSQTTVQVPLGLTDQGPISMASFTAMLGTTEVATIPDLDDFRALSTVEERFGYGHLTHKSVRDTPVWGVGHDGHRWHWLTQASEWDCQHHVLFVSSHLGNHPGDNTWKTREAPAPGLVMVSRVPEPPPEGALHVLHDALRKRYLNDAWSRELHPDPVGARRARALGRLALFQLVRLLHRKDDAIFLPTDGGARCSLRQIAGHRNARVVARTGVSLAEPWTFELTRDELSALGDHTLSLRYDDDPTVWRSLVESDEGWLIRQHVRESGVQGWLGLRHPYDATTGILVQASGRLLSLPEMDQRVPCHGLLWPDGQTTAPTDAQRRLLYLAGLRLYQSLVECLLEETETGRRLTATQYAMAFALRASVRGGQNATANALAERVVVERVDGTQWGSLTAWLVAPEEQRPDLPVDVSALLSTTSVEQRQLAVHDASSEAGFLSRLSAALARPAVTVRLSKADAHQQGLVTVFGPHSSARAVTLAVLRSHPLASAALASPGLERELLLLEMARQVCNWLHDTPEQVPFNTVQQALVAQLLTRS